MNEFKQGDRVIYDGSVYMIIVKCGDRYKLHPIKCKDKPQIFAYSTGIKSSHGRLIWIHIDLISLDYQYYRNEKINAILE